MPDQLLERKPSITSRWMAHVTKSRASKPLKQKPAHLPDGRGLFHWRRGLADPQACTSLVGHSLDLNSLRQMKSDLEGARVEQESRGLPLPLAGFASRIPRITLSGRSWPSCQPLSTLMGACCPHQGQCLSPFFGDRNEKPNHCTFGSHT